MTSSQQETREKVEIEATGRVLRILDARNYLKDPEQVLNIKTTTLSLWNYRTLNQQINIKAPIAKAIFSDFETLDTYFSHEEKHTRLKFNVKSIDDLLKGGIERCAITEIYGAAGSGKTQLCLHLAFTCRLPIELGGQDAKVIYLTTDKPACARRLKQLDEAFTFKYGADIDFLGGIYISQFNTPKDFEEFITVCLPPILDVTKIRLLVIDSIAGIFRVEHDYMKRAKLFCKYFHELECLANQYNFAILVTNHVTAVINENSESDVKPSLGITWASLLTTRLKIEKLPTSSYLEINGEEEVSRRRSMKVEFSPRLAPNSASFIITSRGIEDVP